MDELSGENEIIDLTMPLSHGMSAFPGEPSATFATFSTVAHGGIAMAHVEVFSQLGTHVDAPAHFLEGGTTIERVDLRACIGRAVIVDVPDSGRLTVDHVAKSETAIRAHRRIVLRSGWDSRIGGDGYWTDSPEVGIELAQTLVDWGVVFLGLDIPTPSFSQLHEVHELLLGADVIVAECLVNLDRVHDEFTLVCLPLPLVGLDGSPARIVAIQPVTA
jgi:arylformamidase